MSNTDMDISLPKVFNELSNEEQRVLENYLQLQTFQQGEHLFREGDSGDAALIIQQGKIRLEFDTDELDTEKVVVTLSDGDMLGELALLDDHKRSLSAVAETDVSVYQFSRKNLSLLVAEHSSLGAKIYAALGRSVAEKLRRTTDSLSDHLSESFPVHPEVNTLVEKAKRAHRSLKSVSEAHIDALLYAIAQEMITHSRELAEQVVKETRLGNIEDKDSKHTNVALGVYSDIVGKSGNGIVRKKRMSRVSEIADSMGVVFGLVPVTNPVSTVIFKSMISLKSRNAIILSPNRLGAKVVVKAVDMIRAKFNEHNLDTDIIQVVRQRQNRQITAAFMRHPDVSLVLATGGSGMVKAAYSSGTPAIGVGPGNTPCFIASDANIEHAARSIVKSKSFDYGLICGSEHNLVVSSNAYQPLVTELENQGAAVLDPDEKKRFMAKAISAEGTLSRGVIGQDPQKLADKFGIQRDYPIRLIVVPDDSTVSSSNALAHEKMAPLLSLFKVANDAEGIDVSEKILTIEGGGHTAAIHTQNRRLADTFGERMQASRILVNTPCLHGIIGLTTGLTTSMTLGCGSYGGNSTTDNVTYTHLRNVKRMAHNLPYKKTSDILDSLRGSSVKILYALRAIGVIRRLMRANS